MRYCKGNREWTLPPPPQPPACAKRYEIVPRGVKTEDKQAGLWILSVQGVLNARMTSTNHVTYKNAPTQVTDVPILR